MAITMGVMMVITGGFMILMTMIFMRVTEMRDFASARETMEGIRCNVMKCLPIVLSFPNRDLLINNFYPLRPFL